MLTGNILTMFLFLCSLLEQQFLQLDYGYDLMHRLKASLNWNPTIQPSILVSYEIQNV